MTRGHPKASHFPKWAILNIKLTVLKYKMGSSEIEFLTFLSFIAFRILINSL